MKKAYLIIALVVGVALAGLIGYKAFLGDDNSESATEMPMPSQSMMKEEAIESATTTESPASQGRYASYSADAVADQSYTTTVVFFYAPWCPECQAFKKAINSSDIPAGTQILEASYDNETDLKSKYGVTLQSTFVRVNSSGELQKKWAGYGKDKSLQAVLDNVT